MKILVLNEDGFDQSDLEALNVLEESDSFERLLVGIRLKNGLPAEGYPLKLTPEGKFESSNISEKVGKDIVEAEKWITEPIRDVISAFNLPLYWQNTIYSIVLFGVAIPPMRHDDWYRPVEVRYQGNLDGLLRKVKKNYDHKNQTEPHLTIVVRERMSLSQLIKSLREQGSEITRYLGYLDETPSFDLKDVSLRKKMLALKKAGKSGDEIATELDDEYKKTSGEEHTLEKNQVNRYNTRFEDMVNKMAGKEIDKYLRKYSD